MEESENQRLLLSLPQLIDAALTGPELGYVSFRLLNNILHILTQQMNLTDLKVQYQGKQAMKIQQVYDPKAPSQIPRTSLTTVKEAKLPLDIDSIPDKLVVVPEKLDEKMPTMTVTVSATVIQDLTEKMNRITDELTEMKSLPSNTDLLKAIKTKPGDQTPLVDVYQMVSLQKRMDATEQTVLKMASFIEDMARQVPIDEKKLPSFKSKYLGQELPVKAKKTFVTAAGQKKKSQGQDEADDIESELSPSESKRSIVDQADQADQEGDEEDVSVATSADTEIEEKSIKARKKRGLRSKPQRGRESEAASEMINLTELNTEDALNRVQLELNNLKDTTFAINQEMKLLKKGMNTGRFDKKTKLADMSERSSVQPRLAEVSERPSYLSEQSEMMPNLIEMKIEHAMKIIQYELQNLRDFTDGLNDDVALIKKLKGSDHEVRFDAVERKEADVDSSRLQEIEDKLNKIIEQINVLDLEFATTRENLTNRLVYIENTLKIMTNRISDDMGKPDIDEQLSQNIYILNDKVAHLESVSSKLSDAIDLLLEENTTKQNKLMGLLEAVDILKSAKIDREEFTDALAEKVDVCMINRKVSHDTFNATCDDLSKGIEEALVKLMEQEDLWQMALREIQKDVSEKMDREELSPLRDFMSEKLRGLQQRVRVLSRIKSEQEAAATKSKYLTGVHCLSCDKNVIMRRKVDHQKDYPKSHHLMPVHKSMAPYLAYEMDQLRKQQKMSHMSRNMQHFESAVRDSKSANRYCGGQHTITTPQQRVSRLGHFIEQWGQEADLKENAACYQYPDPNIRTALKHRKLSDVSDQRSTMSTIPEGDSVQQDVAETPMTELQRQPSRVLNDNFERPLPPKVSVISEDDPLSTSWYSDSHKKKVEIKVPSSNTNTK